MEKEKTIFDYCAENPDGGTFTEFLISDQYEITIVQTVVSGEREILDCNEIVISPGEYQVFLEGLDKAYRANLKKYLKNGTDKNAN